MSALSTALEDYRLITDFPGYRVGSWGTVWSRWQRRSRGPGGGPGVICFLSDEWHQLRAGVGKNGHLVVCLRKKGRSHTRYVHRLVLETFVGPCPPGMECRHFQERDKFNNSLSNLCWGTPKENAADKIIHGPKSEEVPTKRPRFLRQLTEQEVLEIRSSSDSCRLLAMRYGVSPSTITYVKNRMTWKHLP